MKEKNRVCEILFSCLIVLSTDVLVSFIYKTHATIFQFGYTYRFFLGAFVSIFPIYVAAKNYKSIVARSMKPWSIGILIITTLIPLFFSDVDFERKVYVWIHYVFLVALPEELFFRVYLPERLGEELLRKQRFSDISLYIIVSFLANTLWGLSHIIFPLITGAYKLEPLWSYITFGIANGWIYTILFFLFRKNILPSVAVHAVMNICISTL